LIKKDCDERLKLSENIIKEKNDYISKLEANIAKLELKLEKFEDTVTNIATSTTHALEAKAVKAAHAATTNNTTLNTNITVNNVLNLSQEHVKKVLSERLNYNVVYAGQAGLATFVVDNILKDPTTGKLIYRCVDPSRQMFEFIDENGETVRDMKAEKLTQSLLKGDVIKLGLEAAAVGWNTENEKLNTERVGVFGPKVNEYADLNRNNTVFRAKVSSLTT
jgi:cell division septum initiation protein DivIVA